MTLDPALAERAVRERVAQPLGLSLEDAARGILAIADNNMVGAIRVVSVERGHDPRGFALVPFGGAGPLHGTSLARLLGISKVLVPPAPGVLCAQGLLAADLKSEFSRTVAQKVGNADWERLESEFAGLESEAAAWFELEAVAPTDRAIRRVALIRYEEQGYELAVPWGDAAALTRGFAEAHRALYGFDLPGTPLDIVTLRVEAAGHLPTPAPQPPHGGDARGAVVGRQVLRLREGAVEAPIYDRDRLGAGASFPGPGIVVQLDATTVVPPGWRAEVHPSGALTLLG
jgi:N-methylhydantoinase A